MVAFTVGWIRNYTMSSLNLACFFKLSFNIYCYLRLLDFACYRLFFNVENRINNKVLIIIVSVRHEIQGQPICTPALIQ